MMKPSMKMGVIALIGVLVVFYQYHLSTGVRFDQLTDFNTGGSAEEVRALSQDEVESYARTSTFTEEMVSRVGYYSNNFVLVAILIRNYSHKSLLE